MVGQKITQDLHRVFVAPDSSERLGYEQRDFWSLAVRRGEIDVSKLKRVSLMSIQTITGDFLQPSTSGWTTQLFPGSVMLPP